jgi:hypothetical protein
MTVGKIGTLQRQPSGRWAICRPGRMVEITSGDLVHVEVKGELKPTALSSGISAGRSRGAHTEGSRASYYSVDGYALRDGMRAGDNR